jgi:OHCU decarboxylase
LPLRSGASRHNHTLAMQNALERLNAFPAAGAYAEMLACCGASAWAREMVARRPFGDSAELLAAADEIWRNLDRDAWLEAFASHPQIGERQSEKKIESETGRQLSGRWSAEEQSGTRRDSANVVTKLAEGNRAYRQRFGYIFIVCATGKTASEMLAILERRLQNEASAELPIAAEEQRLIMRLRLEKLLAEQPR